jgi:hypothetical protein
MAEKASIFQTIQFGVEAVPGTAVAAIKKPLALSFDLQPKTSAEAFRAMGNKYASFVTLNKEWTEFGISGKLTYNEILYALSSLFSAPVPAQQGVTTAYKWIFSSNTSAADVGKTLTIEQGDATTAWKAAGVQVGGLTFTFNRNEVSVAGNAFGGPIETGIALTPNPTSLTPLPVLPSQLKFYMADTQAGLAGASAMTRGFSLVWGVTDKNGLFWPVGQEPGTVETEPKATNTLRLASDAVGMGLITTMRAGGVSKWFRVKATGAVIADVYANTFQLDFPAQVNDLGGFDSEDGIHVADFGLTPVHDATWGKMFSLEITNAVQTL